GSSPTQRDVTRQGRLRRRFAIPLRSTLDTDNPTLRAAWTRERGELNPGPGCIVARSRRTTPHQAGRGTDLPSAFLGMPATACAALGRPRGPRELASSSRRE